MLFSGQFAEALQALVDWLYRVEPQLAEDLPVHGDLDLVSNLMDSHKVPLFVLAQKPACAASHTPHAVLFVCVCLTPMMSLNNAPCCPKSVPGLPERDGQEDGQHSGLEALRPRTHGDRSGRHGMGQSSAAGAEQPLGDGVCFVRHKADATTAGTQTGKKKIHFECFFSHLVV